MVVQLPFGVGYRTEGFISNRNRSGYVQLSVFSLYGNGFSKEGLERADSAVLTTNTTGIVVAQVCRESNSFIYQEKEMLTT